MYADDLLAIGTNAAAFDRFFYSLASLSIGLFSKFLGMRVTFNDDGGYSFDQEEAIGDLLRTNYSRVQTRLARRRLMTATMTRLEV